MDLRYRVTNYIHRQVKIKLQIDNYNNVNQIALFSTCLSLAFNTHAGAYWQALDKFATSHALTFKFWHLCQMNQNTDTTITKFKKHSELYFATTLSELQYRKIWHKFIVHWQSLQYTKYYV